MTNRLASPTWFKFLHLLWLLISLFVLSISYADSQLTLPSVTRSFTFKQLGAPPDIKLTGYNHDARINFAIRRDELVTNARLNLRFSYSPALIMAQSHIKVMLNDEVVETIQLSKENAGRTISQQIELNPKLMADYNHLLLQFVGHYTTDCEDLLHTSLWSNISSASTLDLTLNALPIQNDLALLPEPFFDPRDNQQLKLPFVFAAHPSLANLRAAAVTASWFGKLANWRGARFSSQLNQLPNGHAVVFATNQARPDFLQNTPTVDAPTLQVITNPRDGYSKLLLIQGRDDADLQTAAEALALGNVILSGQSAKVQQNKTYAPRAAYDAPNWVRTDRATRFGELIESPQQLQAFGHSPDLVRLNLRIPPDLFAWRSNGVPLDLKYRYTPPDNLADSRIIMSINNEMVRSFNLQDGKQSELLRLPLVDELLQLKHNDIRIPAFKLGIANQLQYEFRFNFKKTGACHDNLIDTTRAMIDEDSTIDFSGFPHYAELPHLGYFATVGFPFSKYADLSQTVVVLPETPSAQDIEILLSLLARISAETGYPATKVRLATTKQSNTLNDVDVLIIGALPQQSLLQQWQEYLPAFINGQNKQVSQPLLNKNFLYDYLGTSTTPEPNIMSMQQISSDGKLAALLGFESPVTPGRSVVAITAVNNEQLPDVLNALENGELRDSMFGNTVFIQNNKVHSILAGKTYATGHIPMLVLIWYWLSEHPILLALTTIFAILVIAFLLWRTLKSMARSRLSVGKQTNES